MIATWVAEMLHGLGSDGGDVLPVLLDFPIKQILLLRHPMPVRMKLDVDSGVGHFFYLLRCHDVEDALAAQGFVVYVEALREDAQQFIFISC